MNSRDTDKFPFGLGSTKSCSLLFQYQLGFILIFALVFNIHGMQVFYFIVVLNDDIGNIYVCLRERTYSDLFSQKIDFSERTGLYYAVLSLA